MEANRANAQLSTGPKSSEGKQISSQNALKHGLTAQNPVLPTDDLDATETHLVQSLADTSWRLNRVADLEAGLIHDAARYIEAFAKALATLSLHSSRLSRQFERTLSQLRQLQQERKENKEEPSLTAETDFVFSDGPIQPRMKARTRESLAPEAESYRSC
jgi:ABC-type transporter Mla subunit MlaD